MVTNWEENLLTVALKFLPNRTHSAYYFTVETNKSPLLSPTKIILHLESKTNTYATAYDFHNFIKITRYFTGQFHKY